MEAPEVGRLAAGRAVEAVVADHPEIAVVDRGEGRWLLSLAGEVRRSIVVSIDVGLRECRLASFLLRGPRDPGTELYRVLLRKNAALRRVHLCLDGDDDVIAVAHLPLGAVTPDELEVTLGELYTVAEEAFEGLVHLGYPGVFPVLAAPGGGNR